MGIHFSRNKLKCPLYSFLGESSPPPIAWQAQGTPGALKPEKGRVNQWNPGAEKAGTWDSLSEH